MPSLQMGTAEEVSNKGSEPFEVNDIMTVEQKEKDQAEQHKQQNNENIKFSIPVKIARGTAHHPWRVLIGTLIVATTISIIGLVVGNFEIVIDNEGWRSRGTLIAKREIQNDVLSRLKEILFEDTDGSVWDDIENNVLTEFVPLDDREQSGRRRRTSRSDISDISHINTSSNNISDVGGTSDKWSNRELFIDGCNADRYYEKIFSAKNIFAVYKTDPKLEASTKSILDPDVLFQICEAETKTNEFLEENGLCSVCGTSDKCLPPLSLLLILRLYLGESFPSSTCMELKEKYTQSVQEAFTNMLVECVQEITESYDSVTQSYGKPTKCPYRFETTMVDSNFAKGGNDVLRYSSSYFLTYEAKKNDLYAVRSEYARTDEKIVKSSYDTLWGTHNDIYVDSILGKDMSLAMGSLLITFLAMGIHTKSVWLTVMGILQVLFSVPLSYFVYYFIVGMRFFPFLNFIGVFVAAALGADDVFVAVDKWKNARLQHPSATTQDIAAIALPDAASAMLLTTSTTAVAFFATTVCPVAPILCFALFCGLLIMFNYFMNVALVFPALCLYDIWLMNGNTNCMINCGCGSKSTNIDKNLDEEKGESSPSLIHRILSFYFSLIHKFRFPLLVASMVATAVCIYIALTIRLPDSVDVRLLPEDNELELHFQWKKQLLSWLLNLAGSSFGQVTWGLIPADTGKRNNPDSISTLELDQTFNPKSKDAQTYLLGFCDKIFSTDLVTSPNPEYRCPINIFDDWLRVQSASSDPNQEYVSNCNSADALPMSEDDFDACFISWSEMTNEINVLEKRGEIKILQIPIKTQVNWDAPFTVMDSFWNNLEDWMSNERANAPAGVDGMFHTSGAFWWYDTNKSMLRTAIVAAGIAIGFSAIVVLISSRSPALTLFSGLCVTYVLAATTSSLVGFGWDLGFLESICFAILIGISCDFVIHFGHAYIHLEGDVHRSVRTKYAVTHMGPSILAAAVTTFSAAMIMLLCEITFFTKFALILLMTILHATAGSFIVYLVFTVSFGPSEPTKYADLIVMRLKQMISNNKEENKDNKASSDESFHDNDKSNP